MRKLNFALSDALVKHNKIFTIADSLIGFRVANRRRFRVGQSCACSCIACLKSACEYSSTYGERRKAILKVAQAL